MKKLFALGIAMAFVMNTNAQTTPVPEFKNKVMFVDNGNTLASLDKTDMSTKLKTSMSGHS